jgi:beta-lactamase class A
VSALEQGAVQGIQEIWHGVFPDPALSAWEVRLGSSVIASHDVDKPFSGASMVKTLIAALVVEDVAAGRRSMGDLITVTPEMRTGGDGLLRFTELPGRRTLGDLTLLMIAVSDNTATNAIIDGLGGVQQINDRFASRQWSSRLRQWVGGAHRVPSADRWVADPVLPSEAGLSVVTVADHQGALADILSQHTGHTAWVAESFAAQQDRRSLGRWVRDDALFMHKTGTVSRVRHDAGVLLTDRGDLWVGCFTDGGPEPEYVDHPACIAMADAMRATAEALGFGEYLLTV